MVEITHKINEYVSLALKDGGKEYPAGTNKKTGKSYAGGVEKDSMTIFTPKGMLQLLPNELLGIWAAQKNKELFDEVVRRSKQ